MTLLTIPDTIAVLLAKNGARFLNDIPRDEIRTRLGHNLPHWTLDGVIYHVRFSLHDAIPARIRNELLREREVILERLKHKSLSRVEKRRLIIAHNRTIDRTIDKGYGECLLRDRSVARMVADSLKYFDERRYWLYAWVVMPNHVHCLVQPHEGVRLDQVMHSWKSYTSNKANKMLDRRGKFWRQESFDHIIRSAEQLVRSMEYIEKNPEKAGLKEWPWKWRAVG
jgi:REP element-mobilizing transposase RayT